ncbi:MAG: SAM-dependent methyltransferase [Paracoccaceae bacterium]|nr:SAM-dependent methyltransferase [Paracoccaceae bacterium]
MTALHDILAAQIARQGPMSIAEYMAACLLHPKHGYYSTKDPLGAAGDFTTAPEISQMFGELLGLSLAQSWLDQGAPAPFTLAELGPGRGTLMADMLRATRGVPGFHNALSLHLVEASAPLRAAQAERLQEYAPHWHDSVDTLPQAPLFLIANEFFDALPIRQFQRDGAGWRERVVGLQDGQLTPGLTDAAPQAALEQRLEDTHDGDLVETCTPARAVAESVATRIAQHGGAALIVDYGDWRSLGDTLQAIAEHSAANPFTHPGQADLTAHVDFEALVTDLPCAHSRLTPQGVFLERLGITQRAQALAQKLSGAALESHIAAHARLTHPQEMGSVFKCIALYPKGATPPPGLDP